MDQTPIARAAQQIAGSIIKPYTLDEIGTKLLVGDYSAELMLQHLLRHMTTQPKQIPPPGFVAAEPSPSPLPHSSNAPDTQGQDRGQGERDWPHKWDRDGERCLVCGAKDWMPGGCTKPAPQSAVEWVQAKLFPVHDDDGREHWDLCKSDALTLARRCAEAETKLADSEKKLTLIGERAVVDWDNNTVREVDAAVKGSGKYNDWLRYVLTDVPAQLAAVHAELTRLQHENTAHRLAWQNAEARERELREALEWLEEEAPAISHDAWTCSVDMSGDRWTLRVRIDGPTQKFRGRTLIETIQKARYAAALVKHKEAQP